MGLIFGRNWMKSSNKERGCLDFRPRNRYFGCKMNTDVNNGGVAGNKRVGDRVSDQFPAGLRVLVVDDDPLCLKVLEKMLRNCLYEVTTCSRAVIALTMLRERRDGFDIVLSDVYMPDMDGFKLLEHIGLEMDLPVIMMSADDGKDVVMKGITHGACDYLIKPVRIEALKIIWQHVIRKKRTDLKDLDQSESLEDSDRHKKVSDDADNASSVNEGNWRNSKRRKDMKGEDDEAEEREDSSTLKKPRVVWSVELHQQFVAAVNQLGIEKAVPKKILELMNVPGLTRENVASHLQKYRLYLRRLSGVSQHQGGLNTSFLCPPDANFNAIASLEGLDLQALGVTGQFPPQNLATLQGIGRPTVTTGMGVPLVDQINFFSSESPTASSSKMRYGPTQQLSNKQASLLPGLPTTMEPKQFAHLHLPHLSFGSKGLQASEGALGGFLSLPTQQTGSSSNMDHIHGPENGSLMMQMTHHRKKLPVSQNLNQIQVEMPRQPRSSGQLLNEISDGHGLPRSSGQFLNEIAGGHASGLPSSIGQQMLSNGIAGRVLGKTGPAMKGSSPSSGGACASNSSSNISVSQVASVGFQLNQCSEFPGNGFPITSTTGAFQKVMPITGGLEGSENGTHLKGKRPLISGYDMFGEFCQSKNQDWELQNINFVYDTNQSMISLKSNPDFGLGHQGFIGSQKNEPSRNELGSQVAIAQRQNSLLSDNSFRIKVEANANLSSTENMLLNEHFPHDDIMNPLFKQQQEGMEPDEADFCFDGFHMDNIPV